MSPPIKHLEGQRFNKLIAIERAGFREGKKCRKTLWRCRCDCGNEAVVAQVDLIAGATKSCGCIIGKHKRTHGGTGTPEFRIWSSMHRRCNDPAHPSYADYGGRGIQVCQKWKDFAAFRDDMGPRPTPNHQIERVDNNEGYGPDNCVWATRIAQSNNRRSSRRLTLNGETLTMAQWERRQGLKPGAIFRRLQQGWSPEDAITRPRRQYPEVRA